MSRSSALPGEHHRRSRAADSSGHTASIHPGPVSDPVQRFFQDSPQDLRRRKAPQQNHADGRHHSHSLCDGSKPFQDPEACHIFHSPCDQPHRRQKSDPCGKMPKALDHRIREKPDPRHEQQGQCQHRKAEIQDLQEPQPAE